MSNNRLENIWRLMTEYEFEMNSDVSTEFMCLICKKVMIRACSSPCGCRYCFECIRQYLTETNNSCPGKTPDCQDEIINININIQIDNVINNRVSKLIVKCPLEFCEHKDQLRNIDDHLRTCISRSVNCPYCNMGCDKIKLEGDRMKDHLVIENYEHTKLLIEYIDNLRNEMELLKRENVELREENNQQKGEMAIVSLKVNVHSEQMEFLNEEMSTLKNVNKSMEEEINNSRENQKVILEFQTKLDEQSLQIDEWKSKSEFTDEKLRQFIERMEELHQKNVDLTSKLYQNDKLVKIIKNETKTLDCKMCEMQTNLVKRKHGEFVWIIENISGKIDQAKNSIMTEIFSDAFYSHKYGYRMCLELDPDGDSNGKGSHLSVFICLMRGPFDEILSWPFMGSVTFSLMDQQSGLVQASGTKTFKNFPYFKNRNKPKKDRNFGIGFFIFMKHDQLLSNATLIKDDKIIIKCTVTFPSEI